MMKKNGLPSGDENPVMGPPGGSFYRQCRSARTLILTAGIARGRTISSH